MLRWVILVVAVVFLTGAATLVVQYLPDSEEIPKTAVVAPEVKGPQPKIEIEGDLIYDFGKMAKHEKSAREWVVKNTGEAPLEITLEGNTTCSCTVSKPGIHKDASGKDVHETMVIPPGKSDKIGLNWHTDKDLGEDYSQGGTFVTNDPRKPKFMLTVKGKVYPPITVYPPEMVQFPAMSNEEPHSTRIAVYSKERPETKVTKVTSSKPGLIVATAKEMTPDDAKSLKVEKGQLVYITVEPGMPVGDFHEELIIQTDHPKQPEVRVSIGGKTFGPISATPERVRLTNVVSEKGAKYDVTLVVSGDKGTHFDVIRKPEPLQVAVAPDEKTKGKGRYRMTVEVPPGASGTVSGEIVLKTDDKRASEVKIPVSILIRRAGAG
jgi:hypothetical protein